MYSNKEIRGQNSNHFTEITLNLCRHAPCTNRVTGRVSYKKDLRLTVMTVGVNNDSNDNKFVLTLESDQILCTRRQRFLVGPRSLQTVLSPTTTALLNPELKTECPPRQVIFGKL